MKFVFTSFLTFVWSFSSQSFADQARKSDGKVHFTVAGDRLVSHPDKGFHFNKEAPAGLKSEDGKVKDNPSKKEESEIVFNIGKMEKKSFTVNFYVCDDAKTVCEEHTQKFTGNHEVTDAEAAAGTTLAAKATKEKPAVVALRKNKNDFIEDNWTAALEQARAQKKNILVDFRAPWCPACIRLETEVFPQKSFKTATARVIKLSLNVDLTENNEFSERYKVKAIPTMILMDADGNELYRSLDFKPATTLVAELNQILGSKLISYDSMKLEAEAGSAKAMRALGARAYKSMDYAEAVKWLSSVKEDRRLFANAEVSYWAEKLDGDPKLLRQYTDVLEKWIGQFPQVYESIVWRNELVEKLTKKDQPLNAELQKVLQDNIQQIQKNLKTKNETQKTFAGNQMGDFTGFERIELETQLAKSYELLAKNTEKAQAENAAVADLAKIKWSVQRPGELLMGISYWRQLGKKAEAQAWLEKLLQTYPDTYVYYIKLARFFFIEKDYAKALPLAQKAVAMDNSMALRNLKFLAEVQKAMNQKQEAAQTVAKALALPEAKLAQNKKLTDSLNDFKKSLE